MTADLSRFVDGYRHDFERALDEIEAGRKRSHWMWYIFPQVSGLGISAMSQRYAIESVEEAHAFLTHPVLGSGYRQLVAAVWHQVVEGDLSIHALFGSPDDSKLVSSLTLFAGVARSDPELGSFADRAQEILGAAFAEGLAPCAVTERLLSSTAE